MPVEQIAWPNVIESDAFACAPEQMARLYDSLGVEATVTGEVSLSWQGADNAMLIKNALATLQAMANQRSVAFADQEPKLYGGELKTRMVGHLVRSVVETQWGDGFGGASCELAHLGMEAFIACAKSMNKAAVRVFVDAVPAYPSLVVALVLPLADRDGNTKTFSRQLDSTKKKR